MRDPLDLPLPTRYEEVPTSATAVPAEASLQSPPGTCAEQQTCSPMHEMSGEKTQKHGHLWTFGGAKSAPGGVLATAKELLTPGKVGKREGPGTQEALKGLSRTFERAHGPCQTLSTIAGSAVPCGRAPVPGGTMALPRRASPAPGLTLA